jgi:hypothetical protein
MNRPNDMICLAHVLVCTSANRPEWVGAFEAEMQALADDERPNYEKWIRQSLTKIQIVD